MIRCCCFIIERSAVIYIGDCWHSTIYAVLCLAVCEGHSLTTLRCRSSGDLRCLCFAIVCQSAALYHADTCAAAAEREDLSRCSAGKIALLRCSKLTVSDDHRCLVFCSEHAACKGIREISACCYANCFACENICKCLVYLYTGKESVIASDALCGCLFKTRGRCMLFSSYCRRLHLFRR